MKNSKYVRSLIHKFRKSHNRSEQLFILFDIVDYYANHDNHAAWKYCENALEISKGLDDSQKVRTMLMASSIAQYLGHNQQSHNFIEQCTSIAEQSPDSSTLYSLIELHKAVMQGRNANVENTIELCQKILATLEEKGSIRELTVLYHTLGLAYSFLGEHNESLIFLQKAYTIVDDLSLLTQKIRIQFTIVEINFRLGNNQFVFEKTAELLSEIQENELITFEGRCRLLRGRTFFHIGQFEKSVEELRLAHDAFQKSNDVQGLSYAAINLSSSYREIGLLKESVAQLLPLLQLEDNKWWEVRYHAYHNLGMIFIIAGDAEKSIELFHMALAQLSDTNDNLDFFTAPAYGNLGYAYLLIKKYDESEMYLQKVLAIFMHSAYGKHIVSALQNIAALNIVNNELDSAHDNIQKSLTISRTIQYKAGILNAINMLAEVYARTNQNNNVIEILQEVFTITSSFPSLRNEMYAHKLLSMAFEELGDGAKALLHLKQYNSIHEKFWNHGVASEVYDVFRVIDSITHEKAHNSVALQKEHLEIVVRQKHQELKSLAIQLTQRNQILHTFKDEVAKSKRKRKKQILPNKLIESITDIETGWTTFYQDFDAVHSGFYDKIMNMYPNLTEAEIRVCCLMKVDLLTKQIAEILCVSPRTIETHRLRIRKKIFEGRNDDLRKYLIHLN